MAEAAKAEKAEDTTPVPTQAEIDKLTGETDAARKKREDETAKKREATAKSAPEDTSPHPTQKENDAFKSKVFGVSDETRPDEDVPAGRQAPPEELPPVPTQFDNDLFKTAAMNLGKLPDGGGDPQKATARDEPATKNKRDQPKETSGGYATRSLSSRE